MTSSGKILVAKKNGLYVLKMEGDVRLTISTGLDAFLDKMMAEADLNAVVIDLAAAKAIDSTTLGFLAKISIQTQKAFGWLPTIISINPDITRVLYSMGFDQVFNLIEEPIDETLDLQTLDADSSNEDEVRLKVIEAHKILMNLNEENRSKFQELVDMLEAS